MPELQKFKKKSNFVKKLPDKIVVWKSIFKVSESLNEKDLSF